MVTKTGMQPICLDWSEKDRQVIVSPEDQDRFGLTVEEVIRACRLHVEGEEEQRQEAEIHKTLLDLLTVLGRWARAHASQLSHAFCTVRDKGLLFLVVMKEKKHDEALEDDLTRIDLEVARNKAFEGLDLSVLAIPHCGRAGYESFLHPEYCLSYGALHAH